MKILKKTEIKILVIFLAVLGYYGFRYWSLTKPATAPKIEDNSVPSYQLQFDNSQKRYTGDGFALLYPADLTNISEKPGLVLIQNFDPNLRPKGTDEMFQFALFIEESNGKTLEEKMKDPAILSSQKITVDGVPAYRGMEIQSQQQAPTVWVLHNGKFYTLQLSTPKSNHAKWFDEILSSFTYTN